MTRLAMKRRRRIFISRSLLPEWLLADRAFFTDIATDEAVNPFAVAANEVTALTGLAVFDFFVLAAGVAGSFHIGWVWFWGELHVVHGDLEFVALADEFADDDAEILGVKKADFLIVHDGKQ